MLIISILLKLTTFVKSPVFFDKTVSRKNYYESLSNPVMCIELVHQYPSGPDYFFSILSYYLDLNISGKEKEYEIVKYIFRKVDRRCETSVIFTTSGIDFKELEIRITMYLNKKMDYFADFDYIFHKGFKTGIYTFRDINTNFKMFVKIINKSLDHFSLPINLKGDIESYNKSIIIKNHQLCIITENNNAVILKPYYGYKAPSGFIYGLMALIFSKGIHIGERNYSAYACIKDKNYSETPTVFITDGEQYDIKFKVLFARYFTSSEIFKQEFYLSKPKFIDVHNLQYVPSKYGIVFLIRARFDYKMCPDESFVIVYRSEDNTKYFVDAEKMMNFLPYIEFMRRIYRLPDDPCGESKNNIK